MHLGAHMRAEWQKALHQGPSWLKWCLLYHPACMWTCGHKYSSSLPITKKILDMVPLRQGAIKIKAPCLPFKSVIVHL